jgi:8-oxo-dGTP diphosphatase
LPDLPSLSPEIEVAAAVIQKPSGEFLLAQRPEGKPYAGYWEFPGGKLHPDESAAQALERELEEELGIVAEHSYPWIVQRFTYPHARVKLNFRRVTQWRGELQGRENQRFVWQTPDQLTVAPMLPANTSVLKALRLPTIYAITNCAEFGVKQMLDKLDAALQNGLRLIQVREKSLQRSELERFAAEVIRRASQFGARVLLNDDWQLSRALGAAGVHLPAGRLIAIRERPDVEWCGASCHNEKELEKAIRLGVDFAVLGPVNLTRSHPGVKPLGWEGFADLAADCPLPVFAIGGLSAADLTQAWERGAHGLAMIRGSW